MEQDRKGLAMTMRQFGRLIARDCRGATAVEYGLIAAMIVLAMVAALQGVADANTGMWNNISNKVQTNS